MIACGSQAYLFGPTPTKRLGLGNLVCSACCATKPDNQDDPSQGYDPARVPAHKIMSQDWDDDLDEQLAQRLNFPDVSQARAWAETALNAALPGAIELARQREEVVHDALNALHRYEEDTSPNPVGVLRDVACWLKNGEHAPALPTWLGTDVLTHIMTARARAAVIDAINRVTLKLKKEWVYVQELEEHELPALEYAAQCMNWRTGGKSFGHLLKKLALLPDERPPGIRQVLPRGADGAKWQVVLEWGSG